MRWPSACPDARALNALAGTPVRSLLLDSGPDLAPFAERARRQGLSVLDAEKPPSGVTIVKGVWPGVKVGSRDDSASAGPTGAPWIDSNAWMARLEQARQPGTAVWVVCETSKDQEVRDPISYLAGIADAACCGARWAVPVDARLARGLAEGNAEARATWTQLAAAMRFFDDHAEWAALAPRAAVGVVSGFAGPDEFLAQEILNLTARQNQPYLVLDKARTAAAALTALKAVIYPDTAPPDPPLRRALLAFAEAGGLLMAGPKWGGEGKPVEAPDFPRYTIRSLGKGRIALWKAEDPDPWDVAADSRVILSHRHDLVRLWNPGPAVTHLGGTDSRGVLHVVNFSSRPARDVSVWVAGRYRSARLWTFDESRPRELRSMTVKQGLEIHLPPVLAYAAVELLS